MAGEQAEPDPVDMRALTPEQMAGVLSQAGGRPVSAARIAQDVADGAPADADGRLHLLAYTAWLAKAAQAAGH